MFTRAPPLAIILAVFCLYAEAARILVPTKPDLVFDINASVDWDSVEAANLDIDVYVGEKYSGLQIQAAQIICDSEPTVCVVGSVLMCYGHCLETAQDCAAWDLHFADNNYHCRFFVHTHSTEKAEGWLRSM